MSYRIEYTAQAQTDLDEVLSYMINILFNKQAANNFYHKLQEIINTLTIFPLAFTVFEVEPWHSWGWRKVSVNNYTIFHEVHPETHTVYITAIIYSRRDLEAVLQGRLPS